MFRKVKILILFVVAFVCTIIYFGLYGSNSSLPLPISVEKEQFYPDEEHVPVIKANNESLRYLWDKVPYQNSSYLPIILSQERTRATLDLAHHVTRLFDQYGIEYMMMFGTLLGSYLTHSILPWDDDLDLVILDQHAEILRHLVRNNTLKMNGVEVQYHCQCIDNDRTCVWMKYKMFMIDSPWPSQVGHWKMPFIDVTTYSVNSSNVSMNIEKPWLFDTSDIYPLRMRPFGGQWLKSPNFPLKIFSTIYRNNLGARRYKMICGYPAWDHWHQHVRKNKKPLVPCNLLADTYAFTQRQKISQNTTRENLMIGKKVYYSFIHNETFENAWQPTVSDVHFLQFDKRINETMFEILENETCNRGR